LETFDAILIGCSSNVDKQGVPKKRRADEYIPGRLPPLSNVMFDLEKMEKFLSNKVNSYVVITPSGEQRKEVFNKIMDGMKRNLLIYYTGHGREKDGAWCI